MATSNVNGRGVLVPDRDAGARCDTQLEQLMGEVGGGVVKLGPRQRAVWCVERELDIGGFVRCRRGVVCDAPRQGDVGPPAGSPVLRCFGTRDGGRVDAHHKII